MIKDVDNSVIKVCWSDIRKRVGAVEPSFTKIIDELSPDRSFSIYLAYYSYGEIIADPTRMYLPANYENKYKKQKLLNTKLYADVIKDLNYGINSLAMGMVLEKNIEVFIDLAEENITIPWLIYKPGTFFPFAKTLSTKSKHVYAPNNILTISSGARSAFMLPNIGCVTNHVNLQRDYNIQLSSPKLLYEHGNVFKEIAQSREMKCNWQSCLMFLSEKWVNYLYKDSAWAHFKMYLHELAWNHFEYRRNKIYYDIAFSRIQKKRNLKPNPYLIDTANHLFSTALGAAPGYVPACDDSSLPLHSLQKTFVQSYGLKKYFPTIMQPAHYNFDKDQLPIYYSLQNPSTFVFSPKSRKISSTIFEMHELEHIMRIFLEELSKKNSICSGTIITEITRSIQFDYFHTEFDRHHVIRSSVEIAKEDKRFNLINSKYKVKGSKFAADAKFLRGCIRIQSKC